MFGDRRGDLVRVLGTILMAVGVGLILLVAAAQVTSGVEQARVERELAALATRDAMESAIASAAAATQFPPVPTVVRSLTPTSPPAPTATIAPADSPTPSSGVAVATVTGAAVATATTTLAPTPIPTSTPTTVPTATAMPATATVPPVAIRRIVAASIGLDAGVVVAALRDGQWDVPKFVAGHLEGTAHPGDGSNVVLSGHVQSISSGNVFARIPELAPNDVVTIKTNRGDVTYVVRENRIVANDDVSVVRPSTSEVLTLITCTGTFDVLKQDYSHRVIIVAERRA